MKAKTKQSNSLLRVLGKISLTLETSLVTICLGAMVVIVLIQIFMRNALDSGFVVGDPLVKHLVLWVTFLGAGLASKDGSHINIDLASRLLPQRMLPFVGAAINLFSAGICGVLVVASYRFLKMEHESQTTFGMTEIPVWILELIIPIGFALVAVRFAIKIVHSFQIKPKSK